MPQEYDLIVIGNSYEAIDAVIEARLFNARVALVTQSFHTHPTPHPAIYNRLFCSLIESFGNLSEFPSWREQALLSLEGEKSLSSLAAMGVDIIIGIGKFCRLYSSPDNGVDSLQVPPPDQAFLVNNRRLSARAYLIATGSRPMIPNIEGIDSVDYLIAEDIYLPDKLAFLGDHLLVIGGNPLAISLAQNLKRLNKEITLVVKSSEILPKEDREASRLIQAELEAEGIKIITNAPVIQIKKIEGQKWLQAGKFAIAASEILLATEQDINVEGLNLESMGVKFGQNGILVNTKMQTTNPQIYLAGIYPFSNVALYEATIAVKNALSGPRFQVDYNTIPWLIDTKPTLARVGMTETEALKQFAPDVFIVKQYFKNTSLGQILEKTTGFCKIIVRGNGQILGAHIVGGEAGEFIGAIALAMKKKIKLEEMAEFIYPSLTFAEIMQQTALKWQRQQPKRINFWQNFRFLWFT